MASNYNKRSSSNIGAIIGGVAAGVIAVTLGGTLVWYLRNRSLKISRSARRSILAVEDDDLLRPLFLPPDAQTPSMAETTKVPSLSAIVTLRYDEPEVLQILAD